VEISARLLEEVFWGAVFRVRSYSSRAGGSVSDASFDVAQ
jgi:hypothetical protein